MLNYAVQHHILTARVDFTSACLLHYGGKISMLAWYCGQKFMAANQDPNAILSHHIDAQDHKQLEQILRDGFLAGFGRFFSKANKLKMLSWENCISVDKNYDIVAQTMNKEDRNSHVTTLHSNFTYFSTFGHHVSQTMNLKKENLRVCWDSSSKSDPIDWVMNDDLDMEQEPPITFGMTKMNLMHQLYNLWISYPNTEILLALTDIKACFRWLKPTPEVCGTFSYWTGCLGFFFVSTSMVLGVKASANYWELVHRGIKTLMGNTFHSSLMIVQRCRSISTWSLSPQPQPQIQHLLLLNPAASIKIVWMSKAFRNLLKGICMSMTVHPPAAPYHMISCLWWATIMAIFAVYSIPDELLCQYALALDKWMRQLNTFWFVHLGLFVRHMQYDSCNGGWLLVGIERTRRHHLALCTKMFLLYWIGGLVRKVYKMLGGSHMGLSPDDEHV